MLFDIDLTVNDSLDITEIEANQKALYSQLDPSLWLPKNQLPSSFIKNSSKNDLKQQGLYLGDTIFSRVVYTIDENQLNLIYLQLLPDTKVDGMISDLCENDFEISMCACLFECLSLLHQYANKLELISIETDIYNKSLLEIFIDYGYEKIKNPLKRNSPITPHTSVQLMLRSG